MDYFFSLLALPLVLALAAGAFPGWVRAAPRAWGLGLALVFWAAAALLLTWKPDTGVLHFTREWVPGLGIDFSLRLTAFSAWFAVLIFGIGGCIILYAATYFQKNPRLPGMLAALLAFTSAMIGVIWADDFFLLFLFWEATSIISFLLVGFHHEKEDSREKASQALLVTLTGGAAMLAGFYLLRQETGAGSISDLLALADSLPESVTMTVVVILISLGTLTKSAQFPFHFWLPNAMAGPTPVSAFLHSATMVKAGVFLLAVLAPALGSVPIWTPLLATCGILTVGVSVLRAAREDDMKSILASTTLAALGFLTLLAGLGTPDALLGFVIFLTSHALYKAPLFLSAGNLEKRFGSRQLSQLGGGLWAIPLTGFAVVASTFSLLGVTPLPGFLGKEYLLKATWYYSPPLAIGVALAAAGSLALGVRLLIPLLSKKDPAQPKNAVPGLMELATIIPAIGALLLIVFLPAANHYILGPAAESLGAEKTAHYELWHGWTPALGLGLSALALSFLLAKVMRRPNLKPLPAPFAPRLDRWYSWLNEKLLFTGKQFGYALKTGHLTTHLFIILAAAGLIAAGSLGLASWPSVSFNFEENSIGLFALLPVLAVSLPAAALSRGTLPTLVALGFCGLIVALVFLWFSAPDLALTQLLAETLLLFLMAATLHKRYDEKTNFKPRIPRLVLALTGGALVSFLIVKSMLLEWGNPVSSFHLEESRESAYGSNVVNVILVDFRALDTLGEILVLAIAALGATAAFGAARRREELPGSSSTPWLKTAGTIMGWLLTPVAAWIFWRGHNSPGGGFIAALVAGLAFGIALLAGLRGSSPTLLRRLSRRLLVGGLSAAILAAIAPLFVGENFFQGLWLHAGSFHLGTPLLFDLGVFLTVLGFTLSYLRHFYPQPTTPWKF